MEFTVEKKTGSQAVITITTTAEETDKYLSQALKKLGKKIKVDGFRAGHIPDDIVRANVGDQAIYSTALDDALPHLYAEVVMKEKLAPVGKPNAEVVTERPIKVKLTVDLFPEVKLGAYEKISVKFDSKKPTDKEKTAAMEQLQKSFATFETVERAAKMGDRVEIDFEGFNEEMKPIAGAKSANHPIILGSNVFVPGFEEELVGMKAEGTKRFSVKFPKDYHAEELKGAKVSFEVKVHSVEEQKIPKIDDEFAQRISGHRVKTAADLRTEVEASIVERAQGEARSKAEAEVLEKLVKLVDADIPQSMLEDEMQYMIADFSERLKGQGLTLEQFLEGQKTAKEKFEETMRRSAEHRIRIRLGLNEIAHREKIEPTDAEIEKVLEASKGKEGSKDLARAHLRIQKALDHLFSKAITQS